MLNYNSLARQRGASLILLFIILLLAIITVSLSAVNNRYDYQLQQEQHTQYVLLQAKQALLGFAASYDQTHPTEFVGYLPCPDITGDGSANPPCAHLGHTVLGRLPWRTLGLPPLRDGSGSCLWYAVSGSYKNNPKLPLTSDTNGDIIIKDAQNNILHGANANTRAIAVVFAPGAAISGQLRGGSLANKTECGYNLEPLADANQAANFLDNINGIDNATGDGILQIYDTTNRILRDSNPNDNNYPSFVQANIGYNAAGQITFNDKLAIITPQDFAPIYKLMDFRIIHRAARCFENYANTNRNNIFATYGQPIGDWNAPHAGTYRADASVTAEINTYVAERITACRYDNCRNCNNYCAQKRSVCIKACGEGNPTCIHACNADRNDCVADCATAKTSCADECALATNQDNYRKAALDTNIYYPWASKLDDASFKEQAGERFGRIPSFLQTDAPHIQPLGVSNAQNPDLLATWPTGCFNENQWPEWQVWKDLIFYALNQNSAPHPETQIWIKTHRSATEVGTGEDKTWVLEAWTDYTTRLQQRKTTTLAKLEDASNYTGWDFTTNIVSASTFLRLDGVNRDFLLLAAGRSLNLNQYNSQVNYEPFKQIRDLTDFCTDYAALCATCSINPYQASCYKSRIDNYLEGAPHSSLNLRLVSSGAMSGGNIPLPYTSQAVATIPSGNEDFTQYPTDINFFTDFICYSAWSCETAYKKF